MKTTQSQSELLFESKKAKIYLNPETCTLELMWTKNADKEDYKSVSYKGLELLKEYRLANWLSGIKNNDVIDDELSLWLQEEIIPRAVSYGLKKVAIVMEKDAFDKYYSNFIYNNSERTGIEYLQFFDTKDKADAWLLSNHKL
ncbi:hypothetical protein R9C00_11550 [Flammeovirgaceae bacterium SG7u.111]|nr:hypothetical protein [Flammeovirgaceae bacterium SG7u.132]WPO38087.1 hypothetical protein R9C00_11550 [Flammeovirgaceae bacterium SG7u.111]